MTPQHQQQDNLYRITRWDLEEYYDAIALINGKPEADRMWERIERNTRSRPHTPAPRPTRGGRDRMRATGSREQQQEDGKRMTNLYAGSECCGAPLEEVGNHDTVDGRKCSVQICTECGKEYQFFRREPRSTTAKQVPHDPAAAKEAMSDER